MLLTANNYEQLHIIYVYIYIYTYMFVGLKPNSETPLQLAQS